MNPWHTIADAALLVARPQQLVNVYAWGSRVPVQRICERCGTEVDE